ncbi:hypothetical protein M408DRAFT_30008 [Serendipita vermifera MAFF 305830]|uniref:Uncharacterized protein n=1 Tax=Serendipita vermifera MAFF 305830 TaxID=933852 RepID=A0A0C3ALE9_SERVB|nr:hypothetical protein M408DRAFT_30008 [Serendipita vermifera MAFF 305830]
MPRRKRAKPATNSGISEYHKAKRMAEIAMADVARCWCKGFGEGCGKDLGARARRKYAQKERERRLREELRDDIIPDLEAPQGSESNSSDSQSNDEFVLQRDFDAGDADPGAGVPGGNDGGGGGGFGDEFDFNMEDLNPDVWMDAGQHVGPDVQLAFDLADAGADRAGDDDEEPRMDPEDEEDVFALIWDQAEPESDSDLEDEDEDPWQMADEVARWEEREHVRMEYDEDQFTQEDVDDIVALAYNIFRYLPLIPRLQALFTSDRIMDMLQYRQELGPYKGTMHDVFDSEHFRELLDTTVKVDGVEYPHKIGESEGDLRWLYIRRCFAVARTRINQGTRVDDLPTLRTRLEHFFSLGVIPSPHSPKHVNSFLYPFYAEARLGIIGIPTFHRRLDRKRLSSDRIWDSSFVRVKLLVDHNAHDATLPDDPGLQVYYGQLLYVLRVTLPANRNIRLEEDCDVLLGMGSLQPLHGPFGQSYRTHFTVLIRLGGAKLQARNQWEQDGILRERPITILPGALE